MQFSTQYDLYLGCTITIGDSVGEVSSENLDKFLAEHVTQRFPGFTILDGHGFWKGKPEPVFILRILGDSVDGFAVSKIAVAYCDAFKQESVLMVQTAIVGALL